MARDGINLILAYGLPNAEEKLKDDSGELDWAIRLPTRYFLGGRICWQPFLSYVSDADMIVLTPENKLINNIPVQLGCKTKRIALWGHGANLQGNPNSLKEQFKRYMARKADWWFAYTAMSLPLIRQSGFPEDRITVLNNSVDTSEMRDVRSRITPDLLQQFRMDHGITSQHVGVYVGSLYEEKRIEFMLEAALQIRHQISDFELIVVGAGKQKTLVQAFAEKHNWVKYLGPRKGLEKGLAFSAAQVNINPGLVGLGILDAFLFEVPLVTTDCGLHSPEIAYLHHQENGLMTENSMEIYVRSVCDLLSNDGLLEHLRANCRNSASLYSIENMAENFALGVKHCLTLPGHRTV